MVNDFPFGTQTNGIKHTRDVPMPNIDTRFAMVREAGVFDYIDKPPTPDEFDQFLNARVINTDDLYAPAVGFIPLVKMRPFWSPGKKGFVF